MGIEHGADREKAGEHPGSGEEGVEAYDAGSVEALGDEIVRLSSELEAARSRYLDLVDDYARLGGFDRRRA